MLPFKAIAPYASGRSRYVQGDKSAEPAAASPEQETGTQYAHLDLSNNVPSMKLLFSVEFNL